MAGLTKSQVVAALCSLTEHMSRRYNGCAALSLAAGQYILSVREITGTHHFTTKKAEEIIDRIFCKELSDEIVQQVEEIYEAYPRRRDPHAARLAIRTAIADAEIPHPDKFSFLLTAVMMFALHCKSTNKDASYIPYPATWIRRKSYLNAPQAVLKAMDKLPQIRAQLSQKPREWNAKPKDAASQPPTS